MHECVGLHSTCIYDLRLEVTKFTQTHLMSQMSNSLINMSTKWVLIELFIGYPTNYIKLTQTHIYIHTSLVFWLFFRFYGYVLSF
jgi:hypothetical protein